VVSKVSCERLTTLLRLLVILGRRIHTPAIPSSEKSIPKMAKPIRT
jgi:hypothetical protein